MRPRTGNGAGDGRHIDPSLGILAGEGAAQTDTGEEPEALQAYEVFPAVPSRAAEEEPTYYDRPAIKEPVWIWAVPAYFYFGGVAGASALLAESAAMFADDDVEGLVTKSRWMAAAGGAVGTGLLIYDLGRPERFLNMLRVFRPTSPMSIGSWVLATAAPLFAASAVLPHGRGSSGAGKAIGRLAALLGMPLAGYTAVLLSNTAVPVWQAARRGLPYLFVASAASSAAALLELTNLRDNEEEIVARFGFAGMVGELLAAAAVHRQVNQVPQVGRPLREGLAGTLWAASMGLTASSIAISVLPVSSRTKSFLRGLTGTAAGIALRFAVFHAGKASARDPRATFAQQRAGRGAAELSHD
ncbi:MAG TPA: NrfD/PsrC family molybdoenzyme membrane anchor subunit [Actinomycetota bacterium]|nr:NrfD/PsrC family molybdoenzyme membrane anchor subunit [Actinomycetota bacterium]